MKQLFSSTLVVVMVIVCCYGSVKLWQHSFRILQQVTI